MSDSVLSLPELDLDLTVDPCLEVEIDTAFIADVLEGVDGSCKDLLCEFTLYLEMAFQQHYNERTNSLNQDRFNFIYLTRDCPLFNIQDLEKSKSPLIPLLWLVFLRLLRKNMDMEATFKYKTLEAFLAEYNQAFNGVDGTELMRLFHFANWMAIFTSMVVARKSKCLAMVVIPKLLEGFPAKYVLG